MQDLFSKHRKTWKACHYAFLARVAVGEAHGKAWARETGSKAANPAQQASKWLSKHGPAAVDWIAVMIVPASSVNATNCELVFRRMPKPLDVAAVLSETEMAI